MAKYVGLLLACAKNDRCGQGGADNAAQEFAPTNGVHDELTSLTGWEHMAGGGSSSCARARPEAASAERPPLAVVRFGDVVAAATV